MKTVLRLAGVGLLLLLVLAVAGYTWATIGSDRALAQTFEVHSVDFPVPFPIDSAEVAQLGLTEQQAAELASQRAIERGRHLVTARYACTECHGPSFGGGTMVDAFPMGTILGPNITGGEGSRTLEYTTADWDRIVRHGVLPNGRAAAMPAEDFKRMSDQELSDIIHYIQSQPPLDNEVAGRSLGPLGKVLVATGQLPLSARLIRDHASPHPSNPPAEVASIEFGEHIAATCSGCHALDFAGGPIAAGDPSWPAARNLTPHEDGLAGWTYEDFTRAMQESVRPDGTPLQPPMTLVAQAAKQMKEVELQALWMYLQSLPPTPTGASRGGAQS